MPLVLAAGGLVDAAPAHAASTVIYQHGTTRQASYHSYAACAPHAAAMTRRAVAKKVLLPAASGSGNLQVAKRTYCYPVSNGHWSYLVAYRAAKGHPLVTGDRIISMKNRDTSSHTVDTETVWVYDHYVEAPAKKFSAASCDKRLHKLTNLVRNSATFRLGYTTAHCAALEGGRFYEVGYLGTRGGTGYWGDKGFKVPAPMLDVLGYTDPGLDGSVTAGQSALTHQQ